MARPIRSSSGSASEGEKFRTKYHEEYKECFSVQRVGDDVTLKDAKGKGYRMTLLPGNPKKP